MDPVDQTRVRPSTPTRTRIRTDDRITLRFLADPTDTAVSGTTVSAGRVLEWIDKAGYACAVGWSASYCVTAYVGNVHFTRAILPGALVEVHARLIHTGTTSMHVLVTVETASVRDRRYWPAMNCILVFVAVDDERHPVAVTPWHPSSENDEMLHAHAADRIAPRRAIQASMREQAYTDGGSTPRTVFRFLAAPGDANWGGNAHGGTVMRWIDEAAFACAASWSSDAAVAVYAGGIHFARPIRIGDIVEVDARLIHTTDHGMHVAVHVRSANPRDPRSLALTTTCMSVYVAPGPDGRTAAVTPLPLETPEDRRLDSHARELAAMRALIPPIPVGVRQR